MAAPTPNEKFLLFVSYSCQDSKHPFLEKLRMHFESPELKEIVRYFMAEDNPSFGADFVQKVLTELRAADAVLPFLTRASQSSSWVNQEIGFAHARRIPVLPAFDHPGVDQLRGMIQTMDGCPVDDQARVQRLFEHISSLAKEPRSSSAPPEFQVVLKGMWWSIHDNKFPMYLRVEVTHASDNRDAIKSAAVEIGGRQYETEDKGKLGSLDGADFKDIILKFFPTANAGVSKAKLVLRTVRGKASELEFEASTSGWRPDELWKDFKPY